jgi:CrcB protein
MKEALAVGLGGFIGCVARYLVSVLMIQFIAAPAFPYATLIVNVVGCFLIGLLSSLAENTNMFSPEMQLFLIVGILGGFTTYSAFGYQTLTLARDGQMLAAFLNVSTHIILGFGAVWLGASIAK